MGWISQSHCPRTVEVIAVAIIAQRLECFAISNLLGLVDKSLIFCHRVLDVQPENVVFLMSSTIDVLRSVPFFWILPALDLELRLSDQIICSRHMLKVIPSLVLVAKSIIHYLLYLLLVIDCYLHYIVVNFAGTISGDDLERLNKLAAFQRKALAHAFSCELHPVVHFFFFFLFSLFLFFIFWGIELRTKQI